ncbi:MAG: undecaprenyldiphospho-muramoylpentapeptide beta-N-acetylglucosaminyltransferase [Candidatus Pacebacteria bacterium]|nr:undecaprenyldiphospho-muramoylpentapeptide beta-N-acetylglucosaminyltransferase [Candidatus Paceibacterota bacterium]
MPETGNKKLIVLSGGGTGGSVAPLLGLKQFLAKKHDNWQFVWFGTKTGLERKMIAEAGLKYIAISSGKLRRYFSFKNFLDIFKIILAFFQSLIYLKKLSPDLVMSAGAFVSVPLVWAAKILNIPVIVHQQDVRPGLANKLMAKASKKITVTFSKSLEDYGNKAVLTGNPVRQAFKQNFSKRECLESLGLKTDRPTIAVVGGGQGAKAINDLVKESLDSLTKEIQIIHIAGSLAKTLNSQDSYLAFNFVSAEKLNRIFIASDLIISRCGLGSITELSFLKKPVIFIPMPFSHQEDNAEIIKKNQAGKVLDQNQLTITSFTNNILQLLQDDNKRQDLANNLFNLIPKQAEEKITEVIEKYVK